jgi:hypothetical protein
LKNISFKVSFWSVWVVRCFKWNLILLRVSSFTICLWCAVIPVNLTYFLLAVFVRVNDVCNEQESINNLCSHICQSTTEISPKISSQAIFQIASKLLSRYFRKEVSFILRTNVIKIEKLWIVLYLSAYFKWGVNIWALLSKEIKIFKNEYYFSRISSAAICVLGIFWNTFTFFQFGADQKNVNQV